MTALASIVSRLGHVQPTLVDRRGKREAAVSMIMRDSENGAEILFIERARRDGDPWSGQMAFPGGRRDSSDATELDTAERETLEEVGIRLDRASNFGRLDDLIGHADGPAPGLVISCHAYELRHFKGLSLNHEVKSAIWIPVRSLAAPKMFVERFAPGNYDGEFPGIRCGINDDRVIWGLTYRFLLVFFEMTEIPFPGQGTEPY